MPPPFVHLWHADLAAEHPAWGPAEAALSEAERDRQARFRTEALRQTYGRAHGFLRAVLGPYAGQGPAALMLMAPVPLGKPALPAPTAVQFNLSYRAGRALLAVSNEWAVGADVEALHPMTDALALVQELFSGPEQAALRATAPGPPGKPCSTPSGRARRPTPRRWAWAWRCRLRSFRCWGPGRTGPRGWRRRRARSCWASRRGRATRGLWRCWGPRPAWCRAILTSPTTWD
nr:hypothetical protein [Hymenobacter coccineus]